MRRMKFEIGDVLVNRGHRYIVTSNEDWMHSSSDDRRHTLTPEQDWIAYQKQVMEEACRKLTMVQDQ